MIISIDRFVEYGTFYVNVKGHGESWMSNVNTYLDISNRWAAGTGFLFVVIYSLPVCVG